MKGYTVQSLSFNYIYMAGTRDFTKHPKHNQYVLSLEVVYTFRYCDGWAEGAEETTRRVEVRHCMLGVSLGTTYPAVSTILLHYVRRAATV